MPNTELAFTLICNAVGMHSWCSDLGGTAYWIHQMGDRYTALVIRGEHAERVEVPSAGRVFTSFAQAKAICEEHVAAPHA